MSSRYVLKASCNNCSIRSTLDYLFMRSFCSVDFFCEFLSFTCANFRMMDRELVELIGALQKAALISS